MSKLLIILSIIVLILNINSQQIDPNFCNIDQIADQDNLPFPPLGTSMIYQADVERNKNSNGFTEEINEIYDGVKNIGVSSTYAVGQKVNTYIYPNTDELLLVTGTECKVYSAKNAADMSSFSVLVSPNGTEHIVGGMGLGILSLGVRDPNLKFVYLGANFNVRGIPAKKWTTCLFDKKTSSSMNITVSYSDERIWTSALNIAEYKSIPLEVSIEYLTQSNPPKRSTEINSILRYRPGVEIKEELFFTEPGVYCEGRKNTKPVPEVPRSFSYYLQQSEPTPGMMDIFGSLRLLKFEQDLDKKIFRAKYYEDDEYITEIHDYNTGLSYKINKNKNVCVGFEPTVLDPATSSITSLSDAFLLKAFLFNEDIPLQYTGMRKVRGMNTDVWIAPNDYEGQAAFWEWHFLTDQWVSQETNGVQLNEPVLLTITNTNANNQQVVRYFHITNYDKTRVDLYDFDVSLCQRFIANKHIRFTIKPAEYEKMKVNQAAVKDAILYKILDVSKVSLLRIGQIETKFDNSTIFVTFTLYDKPAKTGLPIVENSLDEAYKNLNDSITNNRFVISFTDAIELNGISMLAEPSSFITLEEREGRYVYIEQETGETIGYTTGSVIGFLILFVIVGLAVGFVAGYFLILKRTTAITLPGPLSFMNPNFSKSAQSV